MGGKKNQTQRTKNNARPSSSGRSADLLGTAKPLNPFLAFSFQKEATDEGFQENIDPSLQVVLKKMSKKDSTTKLKALQEFTSICMSEETEVEKIVAVLSFWSRQYVQLAVDIEHKVRESAHVCHEAVIKRCKRNLAPYLRQLAGPWFVSQCDTHAPAANAASRAFSNAFPPNKIQEAILFCQTEIIKYIVDNLTIQSADTVSNPTTTTPEEREMKYQRILISCLQGYALYLSRIPADQLIVSPNQELVSSKAFWKHARNGAPVVRSAWYSALIALCQYNKKLLEDQLVNVAKMTVGCLDETDALVAPLVWDATLHALVALPDIWTVISIDKVFFPKLYSICRKAGHGSASVIFPSLLPLISQIPAEKISNSCGFYDSLFSNLRQGLEQRSVQQSLSEHRAVVDALVECIQYCVASKQESDPDFCTTIVKAYLFPLLTNVESANPKIVMLLKSWSQPEARPIQKELFFSACDHITRTFTDAVTQYSNQPESDLDEGIPQKTPRTTLQKQLAVMTNLLQGDKLISQYRNKKVKFASGDEPEESPSITQSSNATPSGVYESAVCGIAATLCGTYLKTGCDTLNPKFIDAISKLVKVSNSPEIFNKLASFYGYPESAQIFTNFFLEWMHTPENPLFCKETVSLSLQLLFHLPSEVQQNLLDQVLSPADGEILDPKLLLWLLEDLTTQEAKQKFHVEWMKNSALRSKLIELAEKVVSNQEDEENSSVWTLLERVADLSIEEGHEDDGSVLKGILEVFENNLQSDETESRAWLVPATKVLHYLYDSRCLSVLALPSDHSVVQTIFQVYLKGIEQDSEQVELFELCSEAVRAIFEFSGPDSALFKNICSDFNLQLQNFVLSQNAAQTANILTVAGKLANLLKSIGGEETGLLRKLCGPPGVPGTTAGPLIGLLSEHWCNANALVVNAESIVSGGTYRSEADLLADRYSACLAEGIPNLDITGSQMELVKPVLWNLLSVSTLADFDEVDDSMSPERCSLITDMCAALAVTSNLSQYFPSMELTYCVDSVKTQCDQHWKRLYSGLPVIEQKHVQETLLKRAVEDITIGGHYWVRALEYWVNTLSTCLSKEDCERLLAVPAEYYSTVLISRLGLLKEAVLPVPAIPSSGTLETLNLSQFVELVIYLLASEVNQETVALQGLSALSCVHRLDSKRLLFDCNIFDCKTSQVRDVIRTILFIRTVLLRYPTVLTEPHWDLILISMASWIPSLQRIVQHALSTDRDLPHIESLTPTMVCSFVASVCDLYATLQSVLSDLNSDILKLPETVKKESITDAWRDVFAAECDSRLVRLWLNLSDSVNQADEISPMASLVLEHIAACVCSVSLGYLNENMTPEVEEMMEQALSSLSSPVPALRLASYHLLSKLVPVIIKKDAQVMSSLENSGSEGVQLEELVISVFGTHLESLQNELEESFEGIRLGETCSLEPFKEQYNNACGYLLLWLIVLDMYATANADVRFEYASFLKTQNLVQTVLHNVFRLLPQIVLRKPDPKNKITHDYFTKKPSLECSDKWTFDRLSRIACHVFLGVLIRLPASARTWWGDADSKSSSVIDQVISEHCSSIVSAVEMKDVLRRQEKAVENMTVKVHMSTREVIATYTVDDLVMELIVKLPNNYPLGPMSVEIGKRSAAGSNQWRTWLMQITIFLTHQNGSLWDGLALWRNYVVRRYEGVEECYICFCVLHGATYQLPKLSCRTCRKKFHSQCLYKWFQTSNKSTCPICRNLF